MRRCALIGILLAGACVDSGTLDARLKPMVGTNEPTLVAAMGRAPDTSIRTTPGVSLLQWRWQKEYAIPDRVLGYSYTGGPIRPIPLTPIGIVRVGQLTLCADAFIAPLAVSCTNGGRESESFAVDHAVEHGRAASLLVSSTSAFGATDGRLAIHDANGRGFAATWNPARCAAVPMFTHQPCGARALTRLVFSLCEFDDTSRAGGRLLPFDYELRPRGC